MPLAAARDKADDARKLVAAGIDPIDRRAAERQAPAAERAHAATFAEAATACIEERRGVWHSGKSETQWRNTLAIHAEPVLGEPARNGTETNDLLKALNPKRARKSSKRKTALFVSGNRANADVNTRVTYDQSRAGQLFRAAIIIRA